VFARAWKRLSRLERREITWLLVGLGSCVLMLLFLTLASEVVEGDTLSMDTRIVQAFRNADDPSKPIGPVWVESALLDLTAMGGPTILTLVVLAVAGFLALQARYRTALFIALTAGTGEVVGFAMKSVFQRARPPAILHLRQVFETSFPSGHAMQSAIVYLTLGTMLMRIVDGRVAKAYCLGLALLLTFLVGVSRVYLGVHYPTDVLAGWIVGLAWASICWLVEQHFEVRAGIRAERAKAA
jgi:undecaprenyl-diphosphatase